MPLMVYRSVMGSHGIIHEADSQKFCPADGSLTSPRDLLLQTCAQKEQRRVIVHNLGLEFLCHEAVA